jgi:outer membrane biosynthesis protein TonB
MNRLQRKCFIASAATHGLLLILLFAAPAMTFLKKENPNIPVLTFLPSVATDQMIVGGGNPTATQPPAPLPAAPPEPAPKVEPSAPPTPAPRPKSEPVDEPKVDVAKPVKEPKPEVEPPAKAVSKNGAEPAKTKKETPKTEAAESTSKKPDAWKPSFTLSKRNQSNSRNREAKARAEAVARAAAAQRAFSAKVQESLKALGSSFSPGTSIEVPGAGGALFANYKLIVEAKYQQAWITPEEVSEGTAVAKAKIVIRRDGTVIESRIVKPSGIRAMDKSVERALELKFIAPFPEDSKDTERVFLINFDLKTKRSLG